MFITGAVSLPHKWARTSQVGPEPLEFIVLATDPPRGGVQQERRARPCRAPPGRKDKRRWSPPRVVWSSLCLQQTRPGAEYSRRGALGPAAPPPGRKDKRRLGGRINAVGPPRPYSPSSVRFCVHFCVKKTNKKR